MNYCLAIDIAKNKSTVGLFCKNISNPIIDPYDIPHSLKELNSLHSILEKYGIDNISIIMESTSTYHYPIEKYFRDKNYSVIVINPIISKEHKRNLRKTKTDKEDCYNLADIFFQEKYNTQSFHNQKYNEMQYISRYIITQEKNLVRLKNRFRQLIGLVFPEYKNIFKKDALFSENALNFISVYPHADIIAHKRVDALANTLASLYQRHINYYLKKATSIKNAALNSLPSVNKDSVVVIQTSELANQILELQKFILIKRKELILMAKNERIFNVCLSFEGIGETYASYLTAELKDISRFNSIKQLIASCGLDPTIIQSGRSVNYHGPISKRGNKLSRKHLFNVISTIIKSSARINKNNEFYIYYYKKRNEGKHHYASIVACTTKLLRKIYYRFMDPDFC